MLASPVRAERSRLACTPVYLAAYLAAAALPAGWICTGPANAQTAAVTPVAPTSAAPTSAAPTSAAPNSAAPAPDAPPAATEPGFTTGLFAPSRTNLLGDMGGLRTALGNIGVTLQIQDTNEGWGNVSGGINRGATYDGLTTMTLGLDTQKAFGLVGGTFNLSVLNIRGRSISTDNLENLQTTSGILAAPTTRFWEIWYQQAFLDGAFDVKLGQQSLDQEFITSQGSALFINTMMGWPMVPSADLYAGGPAYPLSSLGIRLRAQPGGGFTVLGGVFQDNPPGGTFFNDGQLLGSTRWGGNFNLRTGALFIAEVQYALNQPSAGDLDYGKHETGLPGTYKLGFWYDTASFPSPQFDTTGGSLALPSSNGMPQMLQHNYSIYGVADQVIWRPNEDEPRAVGVFARLMGAPGDRNLISFSINAGVTLKAPLPDRDDDTLGLGFGVAQVSGAQQNFDVSAATVCTPGTVCPVQGSETFLELTYQIQVAPWWQIQPDFQFVFNPGGGLQNPNNPSKKIGNEAVFGLRSVITF
jgi:porin